MTRNARRRIGQLEETLGTTADWQYNCHIPFALQKFPLSLSISKGDTSKQMTAEDPLGRKLFNSRKVSYAFWVPTGEMHRIGLPELTTIYVRGKTALEVLKEIRKAILGETAEGYTALYRGSKDKLAQIENHIQYFEEECKNEEPQKMNRQDSEDNRREL